MRAVPYLILLAATGCASTTARPILRERDGGIVSIPDNSDRFPDYNRSQAEDLIREHVGKSFEIVKEEEYVVGPVTTSETNTTKRPALGWLIPWRWNESASTTSTSATRNQTEYRLHYRRTMPDSPVKPAESRDLPPLGAGIGGR
jgi:hypothetical protein